MTLLTEQGIKNFVEKIKQDKVNVDQIQVTYNLVDPYALLESTGTSGIITDNEYYENVYENIVASHFSCLMPFCDVFKSKTKLSIDVDTEGNFKTDQVKAIVSIEVPSKEKSLDRFLLKNLPSIILFYPYIKQVQLIGNSRKLRNIYITLELSAKVITRIVQNKENYNKQILYQWVYMINKCINENKNHDRFDNTFKVINGKINYKLSTKKIYEYFNLTKKDSE